MYIVIAYDITSTRKRERLAKLLKNYLMRVQKSVFEGETDEGSLEKIRKQIPKIIDMEKDNVRIYHLCLRCRNYTELIGVSVPWEELKDEIF